MTAGERSYALAMAVIAAMRIIGLVAALRLLGDVEPAMVSHADSAGWEIAPHPAGWGVSRHPA
jgi:hypothetical protein